MPGKLPGRVTIEEDVVFGSGGGRNLTCDVFTPPDAPDAPDAGKASNRPAILLLHGGSWRNGDKSQLKYYGIQLARFGYLCVCSEYRLSGEAVWPAQLHDAKAALRWIRGNATRLGVDADRIAVLGNSAGAHLALMLAATPDTPGLEGDGGNEGVQSGCIYGITMDGQGIRSIFEIVFHFEHICWQFPGLTHGDETRIEIIGKRPAEYKTS